MFELGSDAQKDKILRMHHLQIYMFFKITWYMLLCSAGYD